ncbi:MAG: VIT1/CCC1 transporter family protein [Thermoplasmata archaeon]
MMHTAQQHESHPHPTLLSDFILGSQDGLVNVLGIILGLTAATHDLRLILVATFAALGAESISMGAVAFTSTRARRRLYVSEMNRERQEMRDVPEVERQEVRTVLQNWGYEGAELDELLERISGNPKAMLEFMMAFELELAPVSEPQARNSALIVGGATVVGSFIPLLPFLVPNVPIDSALVAAVILSAITLFLIGLYEARTTSGSIWKSGLQMVLIGLAAGFAGFAIGHFLGAS